MGVYIHMNPVSPEESGLGKRRKAVERRGLTAPPTREERERRSGRERKKDRLLLERPDGRRFAVERELHVL